MITGLIIMFTNLYIGIKRGKKVTQNNIWGGETLEWKIETPPTHENFEHIPVITDGPYEYKENDQDILEKEEIK